MVPEGPSRALDGGAPPALPGARTPYTIGWSITLAILAAQDQGLIVAGRGAKG